MRAILDSSVAVKWLFEEPGTEEARSLLAAVANGELDLMAPDLIALEFANTTWKKVRRRQCSVDDANSALREWRGLQPRLLPGHLLVEHAFDLALALGITVYDAAYVAAAVEWETPLITADRRLAGAARTVLSEVRLIG